MSEVPDMVRRLAAADDLPVESDAPPEGANPVPYDAGLQADLIEYGPAALIEYGKIVVRDVQRPERFNSAVWYALSHEPILHYELKEGCVIITDPAAAA